MSWDVYCRLQANGYVCTRYGGTKKKFVEIIEFSLITDLSNYFRLCDNCVMITSFILDGTSMYSSTHATLLFMAIVKTVTICLTIDEIAFSGARVRILIQYIIIL